MIASELKSAIVGHRGGRMTIPSSLAQFEVLHTYEVFLAIARYERTSFEKSLPYIKIATHDFIKAETSHFRAWRG